MELPRNFEFLQSVSPEYQKHCDDCFHLISSKYDSERTQEVRLKPFTELIGSKGFRPLDKWTLSNDERSINFILGSYETYVARPNKHTGGARYETHLYCLGHTVLNQDMGHVFIRPETIVDKVSELFNPIEIDFKGQELFNKKYYCLSSNKEDTIASFPREVLKLIATYDNLSVEFVGKNCLFRMPKAIDQKESLELCRFGFELASLMSKH